MFLTRKQRVRNLDPLMGLVDIVATQKAGHVVARVMHLHHDNQQSGLCLTSGMGMKTIWKRLARDGRTPKNGTIGARFLIEFLEAGIPWLRSLDSIVRSQTFRRA
jgi:hypothetical protein